MRTPNVPEADGVFLLSEGPRPLDARGTEHLRHEIELLRKSDAVAAVADMLWKPDFDKLVVHFANVPLKHVRSAEWRIIEEKKPIFNIPRQAA